MPSVSIVIPSLNCGIYLEQAIRSIILQEYPCLQLIIVDGGSVDQTPLIIEHYREVIDIVISEPDQGQADAINKGLLQSKGYYFNWINADDLLAPNALWSLFEAIEGRPDVIASSVENFRDSGEKSSTVKNFGFSSKNFIEGPSSLISYHQPGVWIKRSLYDKIGLLNTNLRYVFDSEMMIRICHHNPHICYSSKTTAYFRLRIGSKTVSESDRLIAEDSVMASYILSNPALLSLHHLQARSLLKKGWHSYVCSIGNQESSLQLITSYIYHLISRPAFINRFSLGALKLLILRYLRKIINRLSCL